MGIFAEEKQQAWMLILSFAWHASPVNLSPLPLGQFLGKLVLQNTQLASQRLYS